MVAVAFLTVWFVFAAAAYADGPRSMWMNILGLVLARYVVFVALGASGKSVTNDRRMIQH